jgi:hypothetical protein
MTTNYKALSLVLEAHICNPNYSGGRGQEGHSFKPAEQIVCETLYQKNPPQKNGWCSGFRGRPLVQAPVPQKIKH